MTGSAKFFVAIGCLLLLVGVILRCMGFYNPAVMVIKPSSFLILANTAFILAILLKK